MFNISNKMSLQDESFPREGFFEDLMHFRKQNRPNSIDSPKPSTTANETSLSSEQNVSSESSKSYTGPQASTANLSDPEGNILASADKSKMGSGQKNKAFSYLDIHSAYTKNRFKHVASKVGQYIAQIHAEDEKRRRSRNFQRHNSMPETLTPDPMSRKESGSTHYSADELHKMNELTNSEIDTSNSSHHNRHDTSDEVDASTYASLLQEKESVQNFNEYLQTKIDEKMLENITLKRSMDVMRIELTDCKEKLKRQIYSLPGSVGALSRHSVMTLQSTLPAVASKCIQTDLIISESHPLMHDIDITVTPVVSDSNNHFESSDGTDGGGSVGSKNIKSDANSKNVATIQPLSLNFSNDSTDVDANVNAHRHHRSNRLQPGSSNGVTTSNNSSSSHPSSNDSAIEMEGVESRRTHTTLYPAETLVDTMLPQKDGFYYFHKRSRRYISLENINMAAALNVSANTVAIGNDSNNTSRGDLFKKKQTFRRRMMSIFGPCGSCEDLNRSLDTTNASFSGLPLLERGDRGLH